LVCIWIRFIIEMTAEWRAWPAVWGSEAGQLRQSSPCPALRTISLRTTLAAPAANVPKTMSIGPDQKTIPAPIAHPTKGHTKVLKNPALLVPVRRSNSAMPAAKPAAVVTGASSQRTASTAELSSPADMMKAAIQRK
jgi:hypothetical protein